MSLSTRDRRRQRTLNATGHLKTCPTCASLAQPITEQSRRIAAWIPLPIIATTQRLWNAIREHPVVSSAGALTAAALVVTLISAATDDPTPDASSQQTATPSTVPSTPTPSITAPAPASTAPVNLPPPTPPAPNGCPPPVPLDILDPATAAGCPFNTTTVTATDVPAEEGFLATTSSGQPVWIHLVGAGESPLDVQPGMTLTITGLTAPSDTSPTPGARAVDVAYADLRPGG